VLASVRTTAASIKKERDAKSLQEINKIIDKKIVQHYLNIDTVNLSSLINSIAA
jgi:hypothetical protein